MGSKKSGNRTAKGKTGHKGGTGRPPKKDPKDRRTIHKCLSQNLWDLINICAMEAGQDDWHAFIEKTLSKRG